jgi:hypothetical protein
MIIEGACEPPLAADPAVAIYLYATPVARGRWCETFGGNIEIFMKQVFSSPDSAQVGLAHSLLDAAGIVCEVRNDAVSQVMPGMPFVTELWVLKDDHCEDARRLIRGESETK